MATTVEIDKVGRIVVPKKLRDDLHLTPGTKLTVERSGENLVFKPDFPQARMVVENGLPLIYPAEGVVTQPFTNETVNELIEQGRVERDRHNLGLYDDEIEA
jgi:AbrB family looped-hinge helix DNA binding protein